MPEIQNSRRSSHDDDDECLTYISPLLDLDLGDMLDGNLQPVPVSHPRVHNPKTTLPKNGPNLKWQLEEEMKEDENKEKEKEKEGEKEGRKEREKEGEKEEDVMLLMM